MQICVLRQNMLSEQAMVGCKGQRNAGSAKWWKIIVMLPINVCK